MKKLKKNEDNYRFLAERYEAVFSNIKETVFQLDPAGHILYVNNAWENLTGFATDTSMGKSILDYLTLSELTGMKSELSSMTLNGEFRFITASGETKIGEFSMKPLFNEKGIMYGYSGSINDITERKHHEALLTAAKQYAESLNRNLEKRIHEELAKNRQKDHILIQQSRLAAMGEMIASIGHTWRQPLNNLSLLIQDVREARDFGEINDQYIDRFIRDSMVQIKHMSRTINDFRKFYRPNKEKISFSLAESIEDSLSIFSSSLKNHEIQIDFEYRGTQMAYGFPNEFSQVVLNILTNSRDAFVFNKIEKRKIKISIREDDKYIIAGFTDNAGGIDPALIVKIFDPYFTTRHQGTGLGLYMARMILENMEGLIEVENCDHGSRFLLYVPRICSGVQPEPSLINMR